MYVCVCIYMCVYIYIYIYVCVYTCVYIYIYICICMHSVHIVIGVTYPTGAYTYHTTPRSCCMHAVRYRTDRLSCPNRGEQLQPSTNEASSSASAWLEAVRDVLLSAFGAFHSVRISRTPNRYIGFFCKRSVIPCRPLQPCRM